MARPLKVQEKFTTQMLTIVNVREEDGKFLFDLAANDGEVVGDGVARVSQSNPGMLTLVMSRYTPSMRVPIDWRESC